MNSMPKCSVSGCDKPGEAVITLKDVQWGIERITCSFHHLALESGEPYMLDDDRHAILMGEDIPPEIISSSITRYAVGGTVITLVIGRDGIESNRVQARVAPDLEEAMFLLATRPRGTNNA